MPTLSVYDLSISLPSGADRPFAVRNLSLEIEPGKILCVAGESGSGKSMCANAIIGLLPPQVEVAGGTIQIDGRDVTNLSEFEHRAVRGKTAAMIFQEPMTALNPLMRIEKQLLEVFEAHGSTTGAEGRQKVLDLVTEVGLPDPEKILRAYPFQLSGGQRQRVMIAMALALEPRLLIADEPTTALDVTTQAQILRLIKDLQLHHDMAIMFITHDFGVVAEIADQVAVMRHGELVEAGTVQEVLGNPQHDYTKALIAAVPQLTPLRRDRPAAQPILRVRQLNKVFRTGGNLFKKPRVVHASDNVSFDLNPGSILGIVGESGSGKSTTGRCIVRLIEPDSGDVELNGQEWLSIGKKSLRTKRRHIQMIFQDPYSSFNPRKKIATALVEGPVANGVPRGTALAKARELMGIVGLDESALDRYPHEFSGGQRQRIGIARALAMEPDLLIADEAVSALDVSIQVEVLNLLVDLRDRMNLAIIFITHDLCVAAQICDELLVMRFGAVVEQGATAEIFFNPSNDYTKQLLAAVPGRNEGSPLHAGFKAATA